MSKTIPRAGETGTDKDGAVSGDEDSDLGIARILFAHKRLMFWITFAGAAISVATALLIPVTWTATATIMPPSQSQSIGAALMSQIAAVSSVSSAASALGLRSQADVYIGLLGSRNIADNLIARFGLKKEYKAKTLTDARKKLATNSSFASGSDSLIRIAVTDTDPVRAAAMANGYVDELYKQNSRLAVTESSQRRLFFEQQVAREKEAVTQAEVALKATQTRTGVLSVNGQVEAVIRADAQVRATIASDEVALDRLLQGATDANPQVVRLKAELAALKGQLSKIHSSPREKSDPFIPVSAAPEAGLEYLRATREFTYHETLFESLSKQYEIALLDESHEANVIQVVDAAVPPDKKSGPLRSIISVVGTLLAAMIGGIFIVVRERLLGHPIARG